MGFLGKFKDFLLSMPAQASKTIIKNYTADVSQFIKWFETKYQEDFDPNSINSTALEVFRKDFESKLSESSVQRHLSSLRKFFHFLKIEGLASHDPFEQIREQSAENQRESDPWHLKDFKNNLYVYNASKLTIKNYLIDVKQFLSWLEGVIASSKQASDTEYDLSANNPFEYISGNLLEEYKKRLLEEGKFSPTSINRKLSSLRKYLTWASSEGLLPSETSNSKYQIANIKEPRALPISNLAIEQSSPDSRRGSSINRDNLASQGVALRSYSGFPPLRLLQKTINPFILAFDAAVISPFVFAFDKAEHIVWSLRGKPVFTKIRKPSFEMPFFSRKGAQSPGINKIRNIPKMAFAPHLVSTKHLPIHKKIWFHTRFTRPDWYKSYDSYPINRFFSLFLFFFFFFLP